MGRVKIQSIKTDKEYKENDVIVLYFNDILGK